jgi:aminoglycoside/choline kinase family phosphotransferase
MQLAEAEGFKASEEAVSGTAREVTELPFINVLRPMGKAGVSVPTLHFFDEEAGLLYLEDFGDLTLFQACIGGHPETLERYYAQAIDTLVQIHLRLTAERDPSCVAFSRSFDVPLLMWEFEHFLEYGIWARRGKQPMCAEHEETIREVFHSIAELIASQPFVFTHRDYHSRNLMVDEGRLGVIDFQDALLGPATYDLASLLRDSYLSLDDVIIDDMIDRYITGMREGVDSTTQDRMHLNDRAAFRRVFDFTSIQRNLKAAGRFVYIDQVKGNPKFLADIPRTLGYVCRNLMQYPELKALYHSLTPYVPEWH